MRLSELFSKWESVRSQLIDAVRPLTRGQIDWLPEGGLNSIGDLLRHIAETENWWFGHLIMGKEYADITKDQAPDLDSIFAELEKSHAQVLEILQKETIDSWENKLYKLPNDEEMKLRVIVWHVFEHEARHRGQIFMMMRLQGIAPPRV